MSDNLIDDTHVDRPGAPLPPFTEETTGGVPSPAEVAARQNNALAAPGQHVEPPRQPAPAQPRSDAPPPSDDGDKGKGKRLETVEELRAELERVRKESADRRVKLRELEPLAQQAREAEEAQKTEIQKALERAEAAERRDREREENFTRLDVAVKLGIKTENIDLIGSGSREEMEAKALRVKAMQDSLTVTAPPSDRPVEGLRPGASPEPPKLADDSYPESWKPAHIRDKERSQYGQ